MSPGIATMAIGAFIGSWNSYLIPLILLNTPEKFTLPVMIASLNASTDITANQGAIYLRCYFRDPDSHCVRILFQIHHRQYISRRCQRVGTVI